MMSEAEFLEYIENICKRPKMYTPTGTFNEVISFLEGYGKGVTVGNCRNHSIFTPFRKWFKSKFDVSKEIIGWDIYREIFSTDDEALGNLPLCYKEFIREESSNIR